jgi:uncharacterized Zn finger protein
MKLKVYNTQYDRRTAYFFPVDEFHYYEGEETTCKWAKSHELAIRTNDSVGLRIIQRRNIREIDGQAYEYSEGVVQTVTRIVQGSKGAEYLVTLGANASCTCPGFTFRGRCKHTEVPA